jgi:hypothetical protein
MRWVDLSAQEQSSLEKLAAGAPAAVPLAMVSRLKALGLADDGLLGGAGLTRLGRALYTSHLVSAGQFIAEIGPSFHSGLRR